MEGYTSCDYVYFKNITDIQMFEIYLRLNECVSYIFSDIFYGATIKNIEDFLVYNYGTI